MVRGVKQLSFCGVLLTLFFLLKVPSHVYHMVFEVLKNAMQATVDQHLDQSDILPEIKVSKC